ncbi:ANTAR domain-containing protein [Nakamurella leprariae]|uniref:ANTAR domain-containing protein n=1 Tax=Nakamurella leprariae TaxID=2803911 RepID=A0A938YEL5_9ACTN|nr:ANTAR domain-containing protein [Nakamurella leprariae]MBM9466353.1 ANTAR domain-containing protein [Nakamurella leprariae]
MTDSVTTGGGPDGFDGSVGPTVPMEDRSSLRAGVSALAAELGAKRSDAASGLRQLLQWVSADLPEGTGAALVQCAGHSMRTLASTTPALPHLVRAQQELRQGPVREATATGVPVAVDDLTVDPRWPAVREAAPTFGVRALLVQPLAPTRGVPTMLLLSAAAVGTFTGPVRSAVELAAGTVSLAVVALDQRDQVRHLTLALDSNRQIGAAVGVVMTRRRLTYDQAFEVLLRASRDGNRKLRDVADWVLTTGTLPEPEDDGSRLPPTG